MALVVVVLMDMMAWFRSGGVDGSEDHGNSAKAGLGHCEVDP